MEKVDGQTEGCDTIRTRYTHAHDSTLDGGRIRITTTITTTTRTNSDLGELAAVGDLDGLLGGATL
jgi:hypothetical protein